MRANAALAQARWLEACKAYTKAKSRLRMASPSEIVAARREVKRLGAQTGRLFDEYTKKRDLSRAAMDEAPASTVQGRKGSPLFKRLGRIKAAAARSPSVAPGSVSSTGPARFGRGSPKGGFGIGSKGQAVLDRIRKNLAGDKGARASTLFDTGTGKGTEGR